MCRLPKTSEAEVKPERARLIKRPLKGNDNKENRYLDSTCCPWSAVTIYACLTDLLIQLA